MAKLTNELTVDVSGFIKNLNRAEKASEGLGEAGKQSMEAIADAAKNAGQTIQNAFSESLASLPSLATGALSAFTGGAILEGVTSALGSVKDAFSSVLTTGREVVESQVQLQAKTGLVGAQFEKLKQQGIEAFKLGVGESVAEANKIIGTTQQLLGDALDPDEIGKFTARAQALGNVYEKDVTEVIQKSAPFIKQFGLEGEEAFNLISLGLRDGATSQDDLLDTLGEYSQLVSKAGFDAAEFVGIITKGTEAGVFNTDKIGDAIKEADIRLKAGDVSNTIKGLAETLPNTLAGSLTQIVQNGEKGITSTKETIQQYQAEVQKAFQAGEITEAQRAQLQVGLAGTPVEDIGQEKFAELWGTALDPAAVTAEATKAGKAADAALGQSLSFDAISRQLEAGFAQASAAIVGFLSEAFAFFQETLGPTLSNLGETLGGVFENAKTFILPILGAIGGAIVGVIVPAIQVVLSAFNTFYGIIEAIGDAIIGAFEPVAEALGLVGEESEETTSIVDTFADVLAVVGEVIQTVSDILIGVFKVALSVASVPLELLGDIAAGVIEWFKGLFGSTNEVSGAMDKSVPFLERVRDVLQAIRQGAQGVVNIFGVVRDTLVSAIQAIAKLDFAAVIESFTSFGDRAGKAWADAFKAEPIDDATKKVKDNKDAVKDNGKENEKLDKDLKKTGGSAKKAADNIGKLTDELRKLLQEEAKRAELEEANTIADATERQVAILGIERKYARLGLEEQLAAVKGNSKEAVLQREILNAKLLAIDRDFASREADLRNQLAVKQFEQQSALQKRAAETAKAINADLIEELRRQVEVGNVSAIAGLAKATRAGIEAELEASVDAIVESTPEFTRGAEEIKRQLSEGLIDVDTARRQTELLGQTILNELLAVPGGAGNAFADQIRALYDKAAASVKASEAEIIDAAEQRRISAIGSDIVRGIEERVRALQAERDQLLENTELTAKQREEIERGFGQAIDEVRRGPIRDLGNTLAGIFEAASNFTFTFDTADAQAAASELQRQTDEINESLRAGEISYQEAIDRLSELEQQAVDSTSAVAQALQQALQQTADAAREQVSQSLTAYNDLRAEATRIGKDTTKTEEQRAAELNVITGQLADQQTELYGQIGIAAGAAFATAVASGENAFKSLVLVALDSLQALIPILTAQIFGINVASPNPANVASFGAAGIAAAAATTAILQGLVAVARAAVAGFKDGGYTGNGGINDVAGVVHGREFVVNARATAKYRDVLEAMNNGRPLDLIAKDKRSGMYVDINGGLNTVATIMADVRDRLDRIPDQAFMKQQVGVDVALDDRLYERQRFRKQVRGLR